MHLVRIRIHSERFPTQRFYPFNISVLNRTSELTFRSPVVFFVGENGSGKSTLLEAITRKCGIHIWDKPKRHVAHNNPFETRLADYVTVTWSQGSVPGSLFRAETFRDRADFLDDVALCDPGRLKYHGGRILNTLSHNSSPTGASSCRTRVPLHCPKKGGMPAETAVYIHPLVCLTSKEDTDDTVQVFAG